MCGSGTPDYLPACLSGTLVLDALFGPFTGYPGPDSRSGAKDETRETRLLLA